MTTVERLIRNLCDQRRAVIVAERNEQKAEPEDDGTLKVIPADVRKAFDTVVAFRPKLDAAKAAIKQGGFDVDEDCGGPKLTRRYEWKRQREAASARAHEARLRNVEALKQTAQVALLGVLPVNAKASLEKLQRDLEKV